MTAAALIFAAATATAQAPPLVSFNAGADRVGTTTVRAMSQGDSATLSALQANPGVKEIRVGAASPKGPVEARAFALEIRPQGPPLIIVNLQHSVHDSMDHLYRFDAHTGVETSLVIDGKNVLGWIRTAGETWRLVPLDEGRTALARYVTSESQRPSEGHEPDLHELEEMLKAEEDEGTRLWENARRALNATPHDETTLDLLVVFTPAAAVEAGSTNGSMDMLVSQSVTHANRIFANSGIATRLRLVHTSEVEYTEHPQGLPHDLCYLATQALRDGALCGAPAYERDALDEVHVMRDEHGADLVVLMTARNGTYGGVAVPGIENDRDAFSVVWTISEAIGNTTMVHEIGHNLGADHNPPFARRRPFRPYGHGRCNTQEGWRTIMSHASDGPPDRNLCLNKLPLLSGPNILGPNGTPTGDTHTHDVARLLTETTPIAAKFRTHKTQEPTTHLVPFIPSPDAANGIHAFVRIINYSGVGGEIAITAIDDDGELHETWLEVEAGTARHFNSYDLEQGNVKGLGPGIERGEGSRRLLLESNLDLRVLAYARTADGFVTSLHQSAPKWKTAEGNTAVVEFFNPGSNRAIASVLRVINLEDREVNVRVHGYDDAGTRLDWRDVVFGLHRVEFLLGPKKARNFTSWELEEESDTKAGRLGDGTGKWILVVSADGEIEAMSLLHSVAGYITNVSR